MGQSDMRRLPAEWEPQSAILLTWPHEETDWATQLEAVEEVYTRISFHIATAAAEKLLIVCRNTRHRMHIRQRLRRAGVQGNALIFATADSNDTWARDHGPLTCIDGAEIRVLDFRFNGWGCKYPAERDDRITQTLFEQGVFGAASLASSKLVLEGGAIETDGKGTMLATRSSVLSNTRNSNLSEAELEQRLRQLLGFRRFLWLDHGQISGDDTDGHIDTLARFCNPRCICHVTCQDPKHPDYDALQKMGSQLSGFSRLDGHLYKLVPLPLPNACFDADGRRLPASYANFLIVNRAVLVPTYSDPADEVACRRIQELFPDRRLISIDCSALIRQNGSLHCITMQFPRQMNPRG